MAAIRRAVKCVAMLKDIHTLTVLVVDDDPEELVSACRALGVHYGVLAATSGEDALRMARMARPGAIILDVMMAGGKDGFTTFRELRRDPATRDIPVVFLTNVGKATGLPFESAELARYLGGRPAAFLEKPVSADALVGVVAKSLEARKDGPPGDGAACIPS